MGATFITSEEQAIEVVRNLQKHFVSSGRRIIQAPLKAAVAEIYGYLSWDHFLSSPREPESPFDDTMDEAERARHREAQAGILAKHVQCEIEDARKAVAKHSPTAITPAHEKEVARRKRWEFNMAMMEAEWEERRKPRPLDPVILARIRTPRKEQTKASVPRNAKFRGIPITVVKAILKRHTMHFLPALVETASSLGIDARTALGLHEELLLAGLLTTSAFEESLEVFGSNNGYKSKFAHISDKGKSVFTPGSRGILHMSSQYDPDTPVDLNEFPEAVEPCSAQWLAGITRPSNYHRGAVAGLLHRLPNPYAAAMTWQSDAFSAVVLPSGIDIEEFYGLPQGFDGRSNVYVRVGRFEDKVDEHLLLYRSCAESDAGYVLTVDIERRGERLGTAQSFDGLVDYEMTPAPCTIYQSIIATLVGADLWRIAHRRIGLQQSCEIKVRIRIADHPELAYRMNVLADDRHAFLSHIATDIASGISIEVEAAGR